MLGYINRLKTGGGEFMDVSMYDCMVALAERTHSVYAMSGQVLAGAPTRSSRHGARSPARTGMSP
jgi:crotonobetainyl-CoA:carnitine CoA-transferase CaiB-like acyl-CoA transferase